MGGWAGLALGALAGIALVAAFPVVVGVGVVGGGLLGAAVIGLGTASMISGAAALGGKIGRYLGKTFGGGGGGGGPPCSSIAAGSPKTIVEGKPIARVTDMTTHNAAAVKSGVDKIFERNLLITRVGESATCGASKILKGASKTIAGGASVDSGAPVSDPDDEFFNDIIERLDFFSTVTGIAQLPLMMGAAVRTGVKVAVKKFGERGVLVPPPAAAARPAFREAAKTALKADIATAAGRQAAAQGARDAAAATGRAVASSRVGQAVANSKPVQWATNTRAGQATMAGLRGAASEGIPASAMIAAQQYGAEPAAQALVDYAGMDKELAGIVVESAMFAGPTAFAMKGPPSRAEVRADANSRLPNLANDVKSGLENPRANWQDAVFGREQVGSAGRAAARRDGVDPAADAAPTGAPRIDEPQGGRSAEPPPRTEGDAGGGARADGGDSAGGGTARDDGGARTPSQLKEEAQARLQELTDKPVITPSELREMRAIQEGLAHDQAVMDRLYPPKPEPRPAARVEEPVAARPDAAAPDRSVNIFGGELQPTPTTTETARRVGARELETLLETGSVAPRGGWAPTPEGRAAQILQHLAAPRSNTPAYSIRSSVEASAGTSGVGALKNGAATVVFKPGVEIYDVAGAAAKNQSTVEARMAVEEREIQLVNGYKLSDVDRIYDAKGNIIWSAKDQGAKAPAKTDVTGKAEVAPETKAAAAAQHGEGHAAGGEKCATCGDGAPGANSMPTNADTLGVSSTGGAKSAWTQPAEPPKAAPKKELELVPIGNEPVAAKPAAKDAPLEFTLEPITPNAADAGQARPASDGGALEFTPSGGEKFQIKKDGPSDAGGGPRGGEPAPDATWYHGSPGDAVLTSLDPNFARAGNLYGPGGYLAQNRAFSETYAQGGTVYKAQDTKFERPFNADRLYSPAEAKAYLESVGMTPQEFREWTKGRPKFGGSTVYKAMTEVAGGDKAKVNDALRAAGHDVIYFKDGQGNQLANSLKEVKVAADMPTPSVDAPPTRGLPTTPTEFFDGARFTPKVDKGYSSSTEGFKATPAAMSREPGQYGVSTMGWDTHAIPANEVAAMGAGGHLDGAAVIDYPPQRDGVERARLRMATEYAEKRTPGNVKQGYFEFIREPDGTINHAVFKEDPAFFKEHAKPPEATKIEGKGSVADETKSPGKGAHTGPGQAGGADCTVCGGGGETKAAGGGALSDPGLTFPPKAQQPPPAVVGSTHTLVEQRSRIGAAWDRVKSLFSRGEPARAPEVPAVPPAPRDVFSADDVPAQFRSTGNEPLYRGSRSSPEALKARGGFTRDGGAYTPQKLSLEEHVNPSATINAPDQWVSTSSNLDAAFHPMYSGHSGYVYEIGKAGGVDVNAVFGAPQHGIEREFTFNSVEWSKIKGWRPVQEGPNYSRVLGDFVPNPDYTGP